MKKIFLILVAITCFKCSTSQIEFSLLIENTKDGIKITSSQGCAFSELTFSLKEGETQEIGPNGIRGPNDEVIKDKNLASFRFTITKVQDGLVLEGIEGTAWKELSFNCPINGSQLIDQNGMR